MKKYNLKFIFALLLSLLIFGSSLMSQTSYYYYYNGEKQYLNLDKSKLFVSVTDTSRLNLADDRVKSFYKQDISENRQIKQNYSKRYYQKLSLSDKLSDNQYQNKIASIKQNNVDVVIAPYFTNQEGDEIGLSNFLYVKLKSLSDTVVLKQQASNYNAVVVFQDKFMPLWFVVSVTPTSTLNAMELANVFYESGLFQYVEPDLIPENLLACVNDTYFNNQWNLNNTGQSGGTAGVDIKACNAWQISTGRNVVVAVVDERIALNYQSTAGSVQTRITLPRNIVQSENIYI